MQPREVHVELDTGEPVATPEIPAFRPLVRGGRGGVVPPVETRFGGPRAPRQGAGRPKGYVPLRTALEQLLALPDGDLESALSDLGRKGKRLTLSHRAAARLLQILGQGRELGPAVSAFKAMAETTKDREESGSAPTTIEIHVTRIGGGS